MNFNYGEKFNLEDLSLQRLRIYTYPSPILKKIALPIRTFDADLSEFIEKMIQTMYHSRGIGLAAPQVGCSIRLFISDTSFEFDDENDSIVLNANPKAYINPKIIKKEGEILNEEGCLSFPGIYEKVKRFEKISMQYQDVKGQEKIINATGLESICLQHELDHLNGIVFIEKLSPLKQSFLKKKFLKSKKK